MNKREGRSRFNKIYSFTCTYNGNAAVMNMTSVSGHLLNYEFGVECKNWRQTPYSVLFRAPIRKTVMMRVRDLPFPSRKSLLIARAGNTGDAHSGGAASGCAHHMDGL